MLHAALPDSANVSCRRSDGEVDVLQHVRAVRALWEVVETSGQSPEDVASHSLQSGAGATLPAGEHVLFQKVGFPGTGGVNAEVGCRLSAERMWRALAAA